MKHAALLIVTGSLFASAAMPAGGDDPPTTGDRTEFEFSDPGQVNSWQIVNDGVMGGRSSSRVDITSDGQMRFSGRLSLENNGGFASVRLRPRELGYQRGQTIVLRVQGDGRTYTFNLYPAERRMAFAFQADFKTAAGQWTEVELPIDRFVAHSFGRPRPNERLDPAQVRSIGILLGDKQAGPFEILIDSIRVR
jgi:monofunctional biosynthetic peptidoglycan transglycosylase